MDEYQTESTIMYNKMFKETYTVIVTAIALYSKEELDMGMGPMIYKKGKFMLDTVSKREVRLTIYKMALIASEGNNVSLKDASKLREIYLIIQNHLEASKGRFGAMINKGLDDYVLRVLDDFANDIFELQKVSMHQEDLKEAPMFGSGRGLVPLYPKAKQHYDYDNMQRESLINPGQQYDLFRNY